MVTPEGLARFTKNVSLASVVASLLTEMVIVFEISPGKNVTLPLVSTKSRFAGVPTVVAVPSFVEYATVIVVALVFESVTVNTKGVVLGAGVPSASVTLPMLTVGVVSSFEIVPVGVVSSFEIVPVAVAVVIEALTGPPNDTVNVSSDSSVVSPTIGTLIVLAVSPGANERVPVVAL